MTMSKSCVLLIVIYWIYIIFANNNIKLIAKLIVSLAIITFVIYFLKENPEWFMNIVYRFTKGKNQVNVTRNDITTGRTEIWSWYLDYLYNSATWLWGNGLGSPLPRGRAAHNTIIQLLFVIGFVGTLIMYRFFKYIYKTTPDGKKIMRVNRTGIYALFFVFATAFFLDGLYIELYYYMLPLCFIYMKKCGDYENLK